MSAPLEVNDPQALAELTAAFEAYECALVDNDIAALNRMFWDSRNTRIVTFGSDFGIANTEFSPIGSDKIGRQSQTWVRTAEGWRIVSAHVSFGA
jgi:hypothetical protein